MKKRALFAIPLALLLSSGAQAQSFFWGVSYGMSSPLSDTKEFTEGTSWRNMGIDLLAVVREDVTVGVSFGWNVFNEVTATVSSIEGLDIAGTQFRYINSLPILVDGRYYFGSRGGARPFIGVGVGPHLVKERVDVGLWTISDDVWHFGVAPEVGVVVPLGPVVKGYINAKYHYAAAAGDAGRTHSYFGLNIGFAWAASGGM
jgi:opacity protein-like surface antigen